MIRFSRASIQPPMASFWNRARSRPRLVRQSMSSTLAWWRSLANRSRALSRRSCRSAISRSSSRPSHSAGASSPPWALAARSSKARAMPARPSWRSWSRVGWVSMGCLSSVVVAGAPDVRVQQRQLLAVPRWPWGGLAVEAVLQDRLDRAIGAGADLDAAGAGRLQPLAAIGAQQPQDAEAGAEPLFGMWPALEDQSRQRRGGGADGSGLAADPLDSPLGMPPVRLRHVLGQRGVPAAQP